ncbi:unnamed protein product [Notodromas monacha]|uniref:Uncharacterized protein n=1 Tax=Notodromas monacha TaxID=399045 RepID=A0A7R9BR82_9CRUS|nr:unnamed protein product [Notodromas monacha]CAG0919127.1 unnamed protein product [Notodromas monacha]
MLSINPLPSITAAPPPPPPPCGTQICTHNDDVEVTERQQDTTASQGDSAEENDGRDCLAPRDKKGVLELRHFSDVFFKICHLSMDGSWITGPRTFEYNTLMDFKTVGAQMLTLSKHAWQIACNLVSRREKQNVAPIFQARSRVAVFIDEIFLVHLTVTPQETYDLLLNYIIKMDCSHNNARTIPEETMDGRGSRLRKLAICICWHMRSKARREFMAPGRAPKVLHDFVREIIAARRTCFRCSSNEVVKPVRHTDFSLYLGTPVNTGRNPFHTPEMARNRFPEPGFRSLMTKEPQVSAPLGRIFWAVEHTRPPEGVCGCPVSGINEVRKRSDRWERETENSGTAENFAKKPDQQVVIINSEKRTPPSTSSSSSSSRRLSASSPPSLETGIDHVVGQQRIRRRVVEIRKLEIRREPDVAELRQVRRRPRSGAPQPSLRRVFLSPPRSIPGVLPQLSQQLVAELVPGVAVANMQLRRLGLDDDVVNFPTPGGRCHIHRLAGSGAQCRLILAQRPGVGFGKEEALLVRRRRRQMQIEQLGVVEHAGENGGELGAGCVGGADQGAARRP